MKAPFTINPVLVAIALSYRNPRLIADTVLPRIPVSVKNFSYTAYTAADAFSLPETRVARTAQPEQVEFSGVDTPSFTNDHGLDDPVPQDDIDQAAAAGLPDPLLRATRGLTDLIALAREVRVAALVFNAANFAAANKVTLVGTQQWSDYANSTPVTDMQVGLDACIMRPNIGVFGRAVWSKLSAHPAIAKAVYGPANVGGLVTRRAFADLFELEDVYVGEGWVNTAKKGQAAAYTRVWGKFGALLYRNPNADTKGQTAFGFTAEYGQRVAGNWEDKDIGIRGGQRVRVAESVREVIAANDLGYLFSAAVA
ncbi:MAG TPA: hypothetical protein VGC79_17780 [Polyangiaceae bacterium]